jgi:HEAT repeat protein
MKLTLTLSVMTCAFLAMPMTAQTTSEGDRARTVLANALNSKNPETRKAGVKALKIVAGQEPFTSRLEALLKDADMQVRLATIEALAELKNDREIAALKTALNDKVAEVRYAAATALYKQDDAVGREFLMSVMSGDAKISSGMIASERRDAKHTMQTPSALAMISVKAGVNLAPVPYLRVGYSAAEKIMVHGNSGRAATAMLLGKENDAAVISVLRNALTDKDAAVRAAAVQALGNPAMKQDAAIFVPLFNDKNRTVRLTAAASYVRLDNEN